MKKFRTPLKARATYIYEDANGTKFTLKPGENGITEADIAALHRMDDDDWNNDYKHYRKRNGQAPVSYEDVDENESWIGDSTADPLSLLIDSDEKRRLHKAIAKLPEKQAEAVTAVWLNGMPAREYAKRLGCSEANISSILNRAFANLRKALSE